MENKVKSYNSLRWNIGFICEGKPNSLAVIRKGVNGGDISIQNRGLKSPLNRV
jgi:hypothetical protein